MIVNKPHWEPVDGPAFTRRFPNADERGETCGRDGHNHSSGAGVGIRTGPYRKPDCAVSRKVRFPGHKAKSRP